MTITRTTIIDVKAENAKGLNNVNNLVKHHFKELLPYQKDFIYIFNEKRPAVVTIDLSKLPESLVSEVLKRENASVFFVYHK